MLVRWKDVHLSHTNAHSYQENMAAGVILTERTPLSAHMGWGRRGQTETEHGATGFVCMFHETSL